MGQGVQDRPRRLTPFALQARSRRPIAPYYQQQGFLHGRGRHGIIKTS